MIEFYSKKVAWKGMKKIVEAGNGKNVRDLIDSLVSFLPLLCAHFSRPDSKSLSNFFFFRIFFRIFFGFFFFFKLIFPSNQYQIYV